MHGSSSHCVLYDESLESSDIHYNSRGLHYLHLHENVAYKLTQLNPESRLTGWRNKNVPKFRTALCNRVIEINEVKSIYSVSKHLRIKLKVFALNTSVLAVIQTK